MAAHRDPITVRCSKSLKVLFLKGREEIHRIGISQNNKMETLGAGL